MREEEEGDIYAVEGRRKVGRSLRSLVCSRMGWEEEEGLTSWWVASCVVDERRRNLLGAGGRGDIYTVDGPRRVGLWLILFVCLKAQVLVIWRGTRTATCCANGQMTRRLNQATSLGVDMWGAPS